MDDPENVGTFSSWSHRLNVYRFVIIFAELVKFLIFSSWPLKMQNFKDKNVFFCVKNLINFYYAPHNIG